MTAALRLRSAAAERQIVRRHKPKDRETPLGTGSTDIDPNETGLSHRHATCSERPSDGCAHSSTSSRHRTPHTVHSANRAHRSSPSRGHHERPKRTGARFGRPVPNPSMPGLVTNHPELPARSPARQYTLLRNAVPSIGFRTVTAPNKALQRTLRAPRFACALVPLNAKPLGQRRRMYSRLLLPLLAASAHLLSCVTVPSFTPAAGSPHTPTQFHTIYFAVVATERDPSDLLSRFRHAASESLPDIEVVSTSDRADLVLSYSESDILACFHCSTQPVARTDSWAWWATLSRRRTSLGVRSDTDTVPLGVLAGSAKKNRQNPFQQLARALARLRQRPRP
jgi:hypothetical protein